MCIVPRQRSYPQLLVGIAAYRSLGALLLMGAFQRNPHPRRKASERATQDPGRWWDEAPTPFGAARHSGKKRSRTRRY
jgi:hypothetical protein